jgi:hypothetical protein
MEVKLKRKYADRIALSAIAYGYIGGCGSEE